MADQHGMGVHGGMPLAVIEELLCRVSRLSACAVLCFARHVAIRDVF